MKLIIKIITILLLAATLIQSMQLKSTAKFKMVALRNKYRNFSRENVKQLLGELNSGPYSLGNLLGKGGFGQVYKIIETNSPNKSYAFKIIDYKKGVGMSSSTKRLTIDEINFLDKFKGNKYVSQLIDAVDHKNYEVITMVMELMDSDLQKCIRNSLCYNQRIGSNKTLLLKKLLEGLYSIHKQNVAHLDIKPENIMLRGKEPVYADFGLALNIKEGEIANKIRGTPAYIDINVSTKVNLIRPGLGLKSDIYSLGIVFLQIVDRNLFSCLRFSINCTKENQYLRNIIEEEHDYSIFGYFCKLEDIDLRTKEDDYLNCLVVKHMLVSYEKRKSLDDLYKMLYNYENREEILRQEEERKKKERNEAKAKLQADREAKARGETVAPKKKEAQPEKIKTFMDVMNKAKRDTGFQAKARGETVAPKNKEAQPEEPKTFMDVFNKAKLQADREAKARGETVAPKKKGVEPEEPKTFMDVFNKAKRETGFQAKARGETVAPKNKGVEPKKSITIRGLVNKAKKETYSEAKRKQENKEAPKKDYKQKLAELKEEIQKPFHNREEKTFLPKHNQSRPDRSKMLKNTLSNALNNMHIRKEGTTTNKQPFAFNPKKDHFKH